MATLTVRNIPEDAKRRFRQAAAAHGRSMEEHLRRLIINGADEPVSEPAAARSAEGKARIERLIAAARGADFVQPPRQGFAVEAPDL